MSFNKEIEIINENFDNKPDNDNEPINFYEWKDISLLEKPISKNLEDDKCDITKSKEIDKYILKTSVPPCPDLSGYILKSEIDPPIDISNYIKKSEIPPSLKCPDLNDYILKSEIPPSLKCPDLNDYILKSEIPSYPTCPKHYKKITDDPRFKTWLNGYEDKIDEKLSKLYILKKECDNKNSDNKHSDNKNSDNKNSGNKHSDNKNYDNKNSGNKHSDNNLSANKNAGNKNAGNKNAANKNAANKNTDNKNAGNNVLPMFSEDEQIENSFPMFNSKHSNSDYANWNQSGLLLEEEYYKKSPNACDI
jgi:hypothetical protein